ncbi:MAG: DUF2959 family protein [Planctomycetes bacterium]|nr:DUF2959 family protein [Planctomycetota bacterium]
MTAPSTFRSHIPVLTVLLALGACAGTTQRSESVARVDELLTRIERMQAETAVAKESVHAAYVSLCTLVSPSFRGDAAGEFAKFVELSERSERQSEILRRAAKPMQQLADDVFLRWTKDMESFGNSRMRQRSQSRLDETRTRFQSIVGATQAAQIALDSFHGDLRDHENFLRHDLNATSVASIRPDVRALGEDLRALDVRFDATVAAARAYVESAALYGQIEVEASTPAAAEAPAAEATTPSPSTPRKRTVTTLKPKSTTTKPAGEGTPPPSTEATPESVTQGPN